MARSPVTPKAFLRTAGLLWIALFTIAESQGVGPTSTPLPNPDFNCTPDLYVQLPYEVYYANPGDQLCVVCNSTAISIQTGMEAFVSFVLAPNQPFCQNVQGCDIDSDRDQLCFNEGIPESSFGNYICAHLIDINNRCEVPFNITKAVAPVYSFGPTGSVITLSNVNEGLALTPSITNVGLPPAEYVWEYSLDNTVFVPLSNQSSYTKDPVEASGRGYYRFSAVNIANQANPVRLTYTVTVDFSPIITLTTEPETVNPTTTNELKVICSVISHPQIRAGTLELVYGGNIPSGADVELTSDIRGDNAFLATATAMVTGCPLRMYTCRATNDVAQTETSLTICNVVPVIVNLRVDVDQSTNTSARLRWTVSDEDQGVTSYLIQYRMSGADYIDITPNAISSGPSFTITDLKPRTFYEFRMRARNTAGYGDFTPLVNFTTYSEPTVQPIGVWVERRRAADGNGDTIELGWSAVPSTNLYTVTQYEIIYYSEVAQDTPLSEFTDALELTIPTNQNTAQRTYFFRVRAVSQYGAGPLSAVVESPPLYQVPAYFNISITTLQLKDDQAYMAWTTRGEQTPTGIFVNISQFDTESHTLSSVGDFTLDQNTMEACFDNLNDSDTFQYQFCITASLPDGTMPHTCAFPTTASDLPDSDIDCISVTDSVSSLPLPIWAIAVIAGGSGLLLVLVFCGCGLCVAAQCRGTRAEIKQEEPYSSFSLDRDIHGTVKGGFPSRPVSPPRSCITYRRNQHHHQMDWQINNLMDGPATVV